MARGCQSFLFAGSVLAAASMAVMVNAQTGSPIAHKTAEQAYKNIQVLKDTPADRLFPAMQFMTASLGVRCEHCHVEHAFEKDDKEAKKTARQMMQMMFALNHGTFSGKREVTCYSCHRGSLKPETIPAVAAEGQASREAAPPEQSGSGHDVLEKYLQASGSSALLKVTSEIADGTADLGPGVQFPVELYAKAPGKRRFVLHFPNGDSAEIANGESGWMLNPGRPVQDMNADELFASRMDADPRLPATLRSFFSEIKSEASEQIDGRAVDVLSGSSPGQAPVRLYFDKQSGLLVRLTRYIDSPFGLNPTQIDYSDYREVGGVKVAFSWVVARPQGRFTVRLDRVQFNVPVDDSKFAKPEQAQAAPN